MALEMIKEAFKMVSEGAKKNIVHGLISEVAYH